MTATDDNTARIWDARTGQPIGEPLHHNDYVWAASFSPDGTRIVTISLLDSIWDAQTGKPISQPLRHDAAVLAVSFSPDGARMLTVSSTARAWDVAVDLEAPLPEWLPVLLEALGGKRLNELARARRLARELKAAEATWQRNYNKLKGTPLWVAYCTEHGFALEHNFR